MLGRRGAIFPEEGMHEATGQALYSLEKEQLSTSQPAKDLNCRSGRFVRGSYAWYSFVERRRKGG